MRGLALVAGVLALVAIGCARAEGDVESRRARGKETSDLCVVWSDIDALREPPLSDSGRLRQYADDYLSALKALDPDIKVDKKPLPQARRGDLRTARQEIERFKSALGDGVAPRQAVADLARSPFTAASDRLTAFEASRC